MRFTEKLVSFIARQHPQLSEKHIQDVLEKIETKELLGFEMEPNIYKLLVEKYELLELLGIQEFSANLLVDSKEKKEINNFELMHEDEVIIKVDYSKDTIEILNSNKMPFALRGRQLVRSDITEWLTKRLSSIHRTYMSKLYLLRKVGRDQDKVIADSSAISVIDNFWIRRPDIRRTWEEIQLIRDMNKDLIEVMLDGVISEELMRKAFHDMTSLFTLKGAFKKVPYAQTLMKKDSNAEHEVAGYEIGSALGIKTAVAKDMGEGIIACELFTNLKISMFHADDILHLTKRDIERDCRKAVYEYFTERQLSLITKQLERLFILAYVTINFDLHEENFGFLYNPTTFNLLGLAPAFDFNDAFQPWEDVNAFDPWIMHNLSKFIKNNPDILDRIPEAIQTVKATKYLKEDSKKCVLKRLDLLKEIII